MRDLRTRKWIKKFKKLPASIRNQKDVEVEATRITAKCINITESLADGILSDRIGCHRRQEFGTRCEIDCAIYTRPASYVTRNYVNVIIIFLIVIANYRAK